MASPQKEDGYTSIANETMDALCRFRIPGEIRQVIDCIIRKTYGWQKSEDWISNSQVVEMTGMKKGNVHRSLSDAITHKIVIVTDNKFRLNKNYEEWISFKGNHYNPKEKVIALATKVIVTDNKKLSYPSPTKEKKETIQKKTLNNSKNSLSPCTGEELYTIHKLVGTRLENVLTKHTEMLHMVRNDQWKKKYGKTLYFTLINWLHIAMNKKQIEPWSEFEQMIEDRMRPDGHVGRELFPSYWDKLKKEGLI